MISGIRRLRPFGVIIWFGVAIGCNVILGNEEPIMRAVTASSSSSGGGGGSGGGSGGGNGGGSGGGNGGGCVGSPSTGLKGCGGGTAWAHWNPEATKNYTTTENTVLDSVTGLMWQRRVTLTKHAWQGAMDECAALELDGYCDWRLPSRIELLSIVKYTNAYPAIDASAFPDTPTDSFFWTSSIYKKFEVATNIAFHTGQVAIDPISDIRYVRCVR